MSDNLREAVCELKTYLKSISSLYQRTVRCVQEIKNTLGVSDAELQQATTKLDEVQQALNKTPSVLFTGNINCGKSSIVNEILRQSRLVPVNEIPCTARIVRIKHAKQPYIKVIKKDGTVERMEFLEKPRVPTELVAGSDEERETEEHWGAVVEVGINHELLSSGIELIDAPGANESEALDNVLDDFLKKGSVPLIVYVIDGTRMLRPADTETLHCLKNAFPQVHLVFVCNKVITTKEALLHDREPDDSDEEPEDERPRAEQIVFQQLQEKHFLPIEDSLYSCSQFHGISAKDVRLIRTNKSKEDPSTVEEVTTRFSQFECCLKDNLLVAIKKQTSHAIQTLLVFYETLISVIQSQDDAVSQTLKEADCTLKQISQLFGSATSNQEPLAVTIEDKLKCLKNEVLSEVEHCHGETPQHHLGSSGRKTTPIESWVQYFDNMKKGLVERAFNSLKEPVQNLMNVSLAEITDRLMKIIGTLKSPIIFGILKESYDIHYRAANHMLEIVLEGLLDSFKEATTVALRKQIIKHISGSNRVTDVSRFIDDDIRTVSVRMRVVKFLFSKFDSRSIAVSICEACNARIQSMHKIFRGALTSMTSLNAAFSSNPITPLLEDFCLEISLLVRQLAFEAYALHYELAYGPVDLGSYITRTRHSSLYDSTSERWCRNVISGHCAVKVFRQENADVATRQQTTMDLFNLIGNFQRVCGSHHNLLDLYGWTLPEPDVLYIVMEKAEKSLLTALQEGLSLPRRMAIAMDVARGLKALHDANCLHGDLKPESILLAADGTAKVNLVKSKRPHEMTALGAPFHISPETYKLHGNGQTSCTSCDVYAFGMLLWVLCEGTGKARPKVYEDLDTKQAMQETVPRGVLPKRTPAVTDACWKLMSECWEHKETLTMECVLADLVEVERDAARAAGAQNQVKPDENQERKCATPPFFPEDSVHVEAQDEPEGSDERACTTPPFLPAKMDAHFDKKNTSARDPPTVPFEQQLEELTSLLTYFKECSKETQHFADKLKSDLLGGEEPLSLKLDIITDPEKGRLQSYAVNRMTLLVVGQTNSGKTSLVNELLGSPCLPTSTEPCTRISHLKHSEKNYIKVKRTFFTDSKSTSGIQGVMEVGRNSSLLQNGRLEVIDAPGSCDEETINAILQEYMKGALPVVIYVIDASASLGLLQERGFLQTLRRKTGRSPIYYVCNKVEEDEASRKRNNNSDIDDTEEKFDARGEKEKLDLTYDALLNFDLIPRDTVFEECDCFSGVSLKEVRNARRKNQTNRYTRQFDALKTKLLKTAGRVVHSHLYAGIRALGQIQERVFNSLQRCSPNEDCITRQSQPLDNLMHKEHAYAAKMKVYIAENKSTFARIVDETIKRRKAEVLSDAEGIQLNPSEAEGIDECRQNIMDLVQAKLLVISMAAVSRTVYSVTEALQHSLEKAFGEVEKQNDLVANLVKKQLQDSFFKTFHSGNKDNSFVYSLSRASSQYFKQSTAVTSDIPNLRVNEITLEWIRDVAEYFTENVDSSAIATRISKDIISNLESSHAASDANLLLVMKLYEAARKIQHAAVMGHELAKQMCEVEALSESLVLSKPHLGARVGRTGHRGTVYEDLANDRRVAKQLNGTEDTYSRHLFAIRETIRRIPDDLPTVLKPVSLNLNQQHKIIALLPRMDTDMYQALVSGRLGSTPVDARFRMVERMADACKVCWEHGINHIDLRITNILLDSHNNAKLNISKPRDDSVPYPDEKAPFHIPENIPNSKRADPRTLKDHCLYGLAIMLWMLMTSTYCRPGYADTTKVEEVFSAIALKKDVVYFSRWKVPDDDTSDVKRQAINLVKSYFCRRHKEHASIEEFCDKISLLVAKSDEEVTYGT